MEAAFWHGTPRSPLGSAVLAKTMYKSGFSPWFIDFPRLAPLKKTTFFIVGATSASGLELRCNFDLDPSAPLGLLAGLHTLSYLLHAFDQHAHFLFHSLSHFLSEFCMIRHAFEQLMHQRFALGQLVHQLLEQLIPSNKLWKPNR